jgi:two-component system chemotaxis sensor kinase CheA
VRQLENNEVAPHRAGVLPIIRLSRLLRLPEASRPLLHVLVTGRSSTRIGFAVERVLGQREIVVRPFADQLLSVDGITGATELGDGRPVLIVDPVALTRAATRTPVRGAAAARVDPAVEEAIRD